MIDFDFEIEMHYHPENFDVSEPKIEDYEGADNPHQAMSELEMIEAYEREVYTTL